MKTQRGTETVEFALVGLLFFVLLFGIFEVGRAFFTWNTLSEVTRRGARVAAVVGMNDSSIRKTAIFGGGGDESEVLPGLTVDNISVRYLDGAGNPTTVFLDIRFVEVSIVNYDYQLLIPAFNQTINAPLFKTIIPRESLGGV